MGAAQINPLLPVKLEVSCEEVSGHIDMIQLCSMRRSATDSHTLFVQLNVELVGR